MDHGQPSARPSARFRIFLAGLAILLQVVSTASQDAPTQDGTSAFLPLASGPAAGPSISVGGIVNAGSFQQTVSPGALISIFGQGFAAGQAQAASLPLPSSLLGVTVRVNNIPAPLLYVGPTQINCQMPVDVKPGAATVTVQSGTLGSASQNINVTAASPALFSDSSGHGIIQNQDYSLNTSQRAAKAGEVVILYGTGLGATNPALVSGASSPGVPNSMNDELHIKKKKKKKKRNCSCSSFLLLTRRPIAATSMRRAQCKR